MKLVLNVLVLAGAAAMGVAGADRTVRYLATQDGQRAWPLSAAAHASPGNLPVPLRDSMVLAAPERAAPSSPRDDASPAPPAAVKVALTVPPMRPPRAAEEEAPTSPPLAAPLGTEQLCEMIETEAVQHALPPVFFMRLIWKESRFDPTAVSPKGASGIAQFMPATAAERGLEDPFDPAQAIPASAALLSELTITFGNVGLAAAAYNGGPGRVRKWLKGQGGLPAETRDYVLDITGRPAEEWRDRSSEAGLAEQVIEEASPLQDWCHALPVKPPRRPRPPAPSADAEALELVPKGSWGLQLAAARSRQGAAARLAQVRKSYSTVLAGHRTAIVRSQAPARGRANLYAVRLATANRAAAAALCDRLKEAGGSCVVLRN